MISTEFKHKMISVGNSCSSKQRTGAKVFLSKYQDIFAWSLEYLKTFRSDEFKHNIPLNFGAVSFRKKQQKYRPMILDAIFTKIHKMLEATIINPIHHSTQIANCVEHRYLIAFMSGRRVGRLESMWSL
jgi:hypothetical protein